MSLTSSLDSTISQSDSLAAQISADTGLTFSVSAKKQFLADFSENGDMPQAATERLHSPMPIEPFVESSEHDSVLFVPFSSNGIDYVGFHRFRNQALTDTILTVGRLWHANWLLREDLAQRQLQHEQDVEQYAMQITRDFEELTFLQRMVESLELATAEQDFPTVARSVLSLLNPAIEAKTLVFVAAEKDDLHGSLTVVQFGDDFTATECLRLTNEYGSLDGPVVKNQLDEISLNGIRQFVLVPVHKKERLFGWLLAVNRATGFSRHRSTASEGEFGTFEASLLSSAASVMATYGLNRELLHRKAQLLIDVVQCLVSAIDAKDDYTRGHSLRVANYAKCLARQLGFSESKCDEIYMSGLVHDVGKIGVPDAILKKSGPLSDEEFAHIRQHPDRGWAILHKLQELSHVLPGVVHHHEEYDGSGYPDQLAGEDIPIEGRVIAVVDAYDAITSERSYRKGRSHEEALRILKKGAGRQWDPAIVQAFEEASSEITELARAYHHEPQPVRPKHPASPFYE